MQDSCHIAYHQTRGARGKNGKKKEKKTTVKQNLSLVLHGTWQYEMSTGVGTFFCCDGFDDSSHYRLLKTARCSSLIWVVWPACLLAAGITTLCAKNGFTGSKVVLDTVWSAVEYRSWFPSDRAFQSMLRPNTVRPVLNMGYGGRQARSGQMKPLPWP